MLRYNTDGSLDMTFGDNGVVTTDITGYYMPTSVVIDADQRIVVAGSEYDVGTLARYNTDGSLDTTFGVGGIQTTSFGSGYAVGHSVAIQSDGKILVAGRAYNGSNEDFGLARYNTDGSLDSTFGDNGIQIKDFSGGHDAL